MTKPVKYFLLCLCFVMVAGCFARLGERNLSSQSLWFDEAVLFWIAQGQSLEASPGTPPGGLRDVVRTNASEDLSPGGFTLLLHAWSKVSRRVVWLRILPFLLFIASCLLLGRLAYRWSGSRWLGLACVLAPFLQTLNLHNAFEIRPYIMEFCGVILSVWSLERIRERPEPKRFLTAGLLCGIFLFSRYSFITYAFAAAALASLYAWQRGREGRVFRLACFYVPVVLAGTVILFTAFLPQALHSTPVGFSGPALRSEAPAFYVDFLLKGKTAKQAAGLGASNFLSWGGLPMTAVALLSLGMVIARRVMPVGCSYVFYLAVYLLINQVLSIALSYAGFYPWDIRHRWGLHMLALSAVCLTALLSCLYRSCRQIPRRQVRDLALGVFSIGGVFLLKMAFSHADFSRIDQDALYESLSRIGTERLAASRTFVSYNAKPMLRYYAEACGLNLAPAYPHRMIFEVPEDWRSRKRIDVRGEQFKYLILYPGIEQFAGRMDSALEKRFGLVESAYQGFPKPYVYEVR